MERDDWEDDETSAVIVPVSLIHALTFEMLHTIDTWHEDRNLDEVNLSKCFVAMMAAVDAAMERLSNSSGQETLQ
jgi:hypothetical protein